MWNKYKIVTNIVDINQAVSITDLNINGLNKPTIRHRVLKKKTRRPKYTVYKKPTINLRT